MTLYTDKNNRYPAPAPTRIRLSDGTTMTSLTDTQLELFGFFPVPDNIDWMFSGSIETGILLFKSDSNKALEVE